MRIALCDYSGHPFQVELSRELARRGHAVLHLYFEGFQTPHGRLVREAGDPESLLIEGVALGVPFAKHRFFERRRQEARVGRLMAERIARFRPDVTIGCNLPLDALSAVSRGSTASRVPFVFWQQDIYSAAIARLLGTRYGVAGRVLGAYYRAVERTVARRSAATVAIAQDFVPTLRDAFGVEPHRIHVVENWAPLDEIRPRPKDNAWSRAHGLADDKVVLYSGTLGLKHDPVQLLDVARAMRGRERTSLVVVSEGPAAAWLAGQADAECLPNLRVLPFQPYRDYGDVLGCADILVAILEPDAASFSVPSKVLSYLCAARPIALAAPTDNLAARTVAAAGAGVVVAPGAPPRLAGAVTHLLAMPDLRRVMGDRARRYAERHFAIEPIADRFETILRAALAGRGRAVAEARPPRFWLQQARGAPADTPLEVARDVATRTRGMSVR